MQVGPLQVIYAGKAHPQDEGKALIQCIFRHETLRPEVKIVYLENYDMDVGRLMTAGLTSG
jgi:starch phosphorylase